MNEFGRYTETLRALAQLYDMVVRLRRSAAARKGWETRRRKSMDASK